MSDEAARPQVDSEPVLQRVKAFCAAHTDCAHRVLQRVPSCQRTFCLERRRSGDAHAVHEGHRTTSLEFALETADERFSDARAARVPAEARGGPAPRRRTGRAPRGRAARRHRRVVRARSCPARRPQGTGGRSRPEAARRRPVRRARCLPSALSRLCSRLVGGRGADETRGTRDARQERGGQLERGAGEAAGGESHGRRADAVGTARREVALRPAPFAGKRRGLLERASQPLPRARRCR